MTVSPATEPARPGGQAPGNQTGDWNRRVWRLAGPIILANLTTPLLGAVDTAVVGHLPDPSFIGGVAVGSVIFSFIFWGFGFLRMGTTGFTAQAHGAGDTAELRACLLRPLGLALGFGLLVILLQSPVRSIALWAMDASAEVEGHTAVYFDVRVWSAPAALVNYVVLGWLLGVQRAQAALVLQLLLNGTNILLDLVFVIGLDWGVAGVAWATFLAESVAALAGLAFILGALKLRPVRTDWIRLRDPARLAALLRVNFDIFLRTLCLVLAFAVFTSDGAGFGDVILAGNAILLQFQSIVAYGLDGFAHAAEILAGSALGARNRATFRRAVVVCTLWGLAGALVATLVLLAVGPLLIALFTSLPEVRASAETYLWWVIASPLISVWSFLLDGIFIGATRTAAMRNAMLASLAVFLLADWLLLGPLGNHGLWLSFMIFMAARAVTLAVCYPALEATLAPQGDAGAGAGGRRSG
ncbi:MATE family efflux transporter [Pelagibius sp. CAU 1746]|uniref:MATE family efflux transporter n=1 Tax=Pelagibius sp. CAU 1746 TaxID=3140370 RepID=UPI00325C1A55